MSQVIHSLSKIKLFNNQLSVLEKGLNFCPSTKDLDREELSDNPFVYCRKLRLKHHSSKNYSMIQYINIRHESMNKELRKSSVQ